MTPPKESPGDAGKTHYDAVESGAICHPECAIAEIVRLRRLLAEALKDAPDARVPREPTLAMAKAGEECDVTEAGPLVSMRQAAMIWRAMYDAAMSAPAPEGR